LCKLACACVCMCACVCYLRCGAATDILPSPSGYSDTATCASCSYTTGTSTGCALRKPTRASTNFAMRSRGRKRGIKAWKLSPSSCRHVQNEMCAHAHTTKALQHSATPVAVCGSIKHAHTNTHAATHCNT